MRHMAFPTTSEAIRMQTKTVTRRPGWLSLHVGDYLQPVVKAQGLKKGEHQKLIGGPIRVVSVTREPVNRISPQDIVLEGFPGRSIVWFVQMCCKANKCKPDDLCTRIEFEYCHKSEESHDSG
jgi:uncharacterized protein (UPF0179 family)